MENTCNAGDKNGRSLRPLLPASRGARRTGPAPLVAKRPRVSNACSACRSRKSKCSAERPKCTKCISYNTACEYASTERQLLHQRYDDLRSQQTAFAELLNQLVTLPEDESYEMLRRIRAHKDTTPLPTPAPRPHPNRNASSEVVHEAHHNRLKRKVKQLEQRSNDMDDLYGVLQHSPEHGANELCRHIRRGISPDDVPTLTGQRLSRSPSPNLTNRNILPPTSTSIEFQLIALHSNAYPSLIPLDVSSIDLGLLGISPLTSFRHGDSVRGSRRNQKDSMPKYEQQSLLAPFSASDQEKRVYPPPDSSGHYIDDRLNRLHIRAWTDVPIQSDFAARVISLYLVNDAPWWVYFNIDLFLEDLVSGGTRFCSSFLVNSLLSYACQTYAYFEPAAFSIGQSFLHEASQLYDAIKDVDCLTTVAATPLLCLAWSTYGKDKVGLEFLKENAAMAERLHLYNVAADAPPSPLNLDDDDIKTAAAATAWGSFNFQMIMSMSYRRKPFVKIPPKLPVPGDSSKDDSVDRARPLYQGKVYTHVCKLWLVAFEMNYQYFYEDVIVLPTAELIFHKLLGWADDLEEGIKRGEHTPDVVANLHIWFHTIVLDLFRPFVDLKPQPKLATFAQDKATPRMVVEASIKQLKRLIYTFRAESQSANYNITWQSGMLYLFNHILHNYTDKEAHFYLLLCIRGWQKLARTFPIIGGIAKSVVAMAVQRMVILPEDAWKLVEEIESEGERIHEYMSTYPLNVYLIANPETDTLGKLIQDSKNIGPVIPKELEIPEGWGGDSVALFTTLLEEGGEDGTGVDELPSQESQQK